PELGTKSLSYMPHFGNRHVQIPEPRPPKSVAARVALRSIGRRRQNTSVLDVAIVVRKCLKRKRHQLGIALVRSLRGLDANLLYGEGRRSKRRAGRARRLAVTGNRDIGTVERGGRTAVIPVLSYPSVGRTERIEVFTGAEKIILGSIGGAPGKASL